MVDCRRHLASSGIDRDHRDRFTGLAAIMRPAAAGTPIGDPLGIAFFATMHRAYLHTPGVEMTVASRGRTHRVFGHWQTRAGGRCWRP
jgi:hypothetical protein